jgi:ribonuclease HI
MFLWQASHNLLPTKVNLMRRGVVKEIMCPICLREEESIEHSIWTCLLAADVWCCGPISLQKSHGQGLCFAELLEMVINRCSRKEVELFAVMARRIWLRRNDVVHGGFLTHPSRVIAEAVTALEDFHRVNGEQTSERRLIAVVEETRWQPPQGNMIKINWDAAIDNKNGVVGVGVIARDAQGCCVSAYSVTMNMTVSPATAKALAALHATIFAREKEFTGVLFEGDAANIVAAVNSSNPCESSFGHFVEDVKTGLDLVGNCSFAHVKREANLATHTIAKTACKRVTGSYWWHCTPSFLDGIIRKEGMSPSM